MGTWNAETAEWYAEKYGEYATNRIATAPLQIAPDAVVVDIGCGTGAALRHLVSRVPTGRLIGVDPVARMLEIARERAEAHPDGDRIEFRQGTASSLPVEEAIADWVLAFDSVDHWSDREAGLLEARRVLRPGGRLAIVKDGGLPGESEARNALTHALRQTSFEVQEEQTLVEGPVTCTLWVCQRSPSR